MASHSNTHAEMKQAESLPLKAGHHDLRNKYSHTNLPCYSKQTLLLKEAV